MLGSAITPLDESLQEAFAQLASVVSVVREATRRASPSDRAEAACVALRTADELQALAVECIDTTDIETATGLSTEMLLQLEAGRMGSEARMITHAASTLHTMPNLASAFSGGTVSWGQVRAIMQGCKTVRTGGRAAIDALIGANAPVLAGADPDRLVAIVDDEVARQRADLAAAREDRAIQKGFLSVQARLDGKASFYGEGDAESSATIVTALDAASEAPEAPDKRGVTRAQQRYEALLRICEGFLSGQSGGSGRPKPRILVSMDLKDLTDPACADAMKLLWPLTGRPPRLTASRATCCCATPRSSRSYSTGLSPSLWATPPTPSAPRSAPP